MNSMYLKQRIILIVTLLMVFGLVLLSGCASLTGKTAGESIDDSTITTKVNAEIVKDPDARFFKINVTVTQGDVVLNGFVNSKDTEERLISKVSTIRGVKSVKSLLKLEQK